MQAPNEVQQHNLTSKESWPLFTSLNLTMTAFTITKYIYLRNQTPTPQGLVSSGIDRDASEWTKSPGGNLTLVMEATPTGGVNLTLRRANETLECLDVEEISRKFAGVYDKSNPPIVAICKQNGIGFKYLVRRFHVMVSILIPCLTTFLTNCDLLHSVMIPNLIPPFWYPMQHTWIPLTAPHSNTDVPIPGQVRLQSWVRTGRGASRKCRCLY